MLVSFNWLKQFVNLPDLVSAEEVAHKLTMSAVEVDSVKKLAEGLEGIIVGEVKKIENHPDADRLQVCSVFDGKENIQVVCGGSNVKEGMLCAFAPIGSKVRWHGVGEPIILEKTKIRGVESNGMICASTEIGLGEMFPLKDKKEILDLSLPPLNLPLVNGEKNVIGKPLAEVLGLEDSILEIDNKSMTNRPDLWGHYGMAREVAALYNKQLSEYSPPTIPPPRLPLVKGEGKLEKTKINVKVEDAKLCPRYMAVAIAGVEIKSSPDWLQKRLLAVGLRPINNIVDITNYVMYELGQPMHAFDEAKVKSQKSIKSKVISLFVRRAKSGEKFKTLDEKEHELGESDLVIANEEKAIALAGVMGGVDSGINNETKTIIFESANFEPVGVRRTALRLGLRTDSSARFEKSLDPNNCELALRRAVQLTLELCPQAKVVSRVVDEANFNLQTGPIELNLQFLWRKVGMELDKKIVIKILNSLGFAIKEKKEGLIIIIPTWRATKDISIAEDLVEEISRIYGYDNITPALPVFPIIPPIVNEQRLLERKVADVLAMELGYCETYNYSFVSLEQIQKMGDKVEKYIELNNPLSKEKPYLRRNLIMNLLENISKNIEYDDEVKIFEIGKTFKAEATGARAKTNSDELLPLQDTWATAVRANKKDNTPFWQVRRVLETIFSTLHIPIINAPLDKVQPWEHPSRGALFSVFGKVVCVVSEINPVVAKSFGIEARVGFISINLSVLSELLVENRPETKYLPLPTYPEVTRDLAILVKKNVTHAEIIKTILGVDPFLKNVELFDVYEGQNIGEGYKSMAYRLTYGHLERTLTADEVERVQEKVLNLLKEKFGAETRG
jgi:phenylalanyl-tRNA synthetase beta chain